MRLHVTPPKPTDGSPPSSEGPLPLAETIRAWRLNPPLDRALELVTPKLRLFAGWTTPQLGQRLQLAEKELCRLEFLTSHPPAEWTGSTWLEAMSRAADAGATVTAIRRVLAGRREPGPTVDGEK